MNLLGIEAFLHHCCNIGIQIGKESNPIVTFDVVQDERLEYLNLHLHLLCSVFPTSKM